MDNIMTYIKWRGDLSFDQLSFNEVDSLILTMVSYVDFDNIVKDGNKLTIAQASKQYFEMYDEETLKARVSLTAQTNDMLKEMAKQKRYRDLVLLDYINKIDETSAEQFSALTIQMPYDIIYVAFRGTDDTIVGWKEDFEMTYMDVVPAQRAAVVHLNHVFDYFTKQIKHVFKMPRIWIGGHSKGGNLAMYAASFCDSAIKKQIIHIDNFDGPGFQDNVLNSEGFKNILPLIVSTVPMGSIFGRLMEHPETYQVVKSNEIGLFQHDAFSWGIEPTHFAYADELSEKSLEAQTRINELLESVDMASRERIVDKLYSLFTDLDIHTLTDVSKLSFKQVIAGANEMRNVSGDDLRIMFDLVKIIWDQMDIWALLTKKD